MEIKKRLPHIDLLESLAIFFVIMYHTTIYNYDIIESGRITNYLLYFGRTILSTCVPLFFFTNGYLLFNKEFELKKHIKKMIRIILLAICWSLFLMTIYLLISEEPFSVNTIVMSVLNLDTSWNVNFFWFLGALICIYIFFPALKALFDTSKKTFIFFTIVCAIMTFGYVLGNHLLAFLRYITKHNLTSLAYPFITMFNPFIGFYGYSIVYFCVGGLAYTYEARLLKIAKMKRNTLSVVGIIISCVLLFLVGTFFTKYVDNTLWDIVWNGYNTILTFCMVISLYVLSLNYTKDYSLIRNISNNTLGIYIIHGLILRLTQPWIKTQINLCNLPFNILYALGMLFGCLLICLIIKKIPVLKKTI